MSFFSRPFAHSSKLCSSITPEVKELLENEYRSRRILPFISFNLKTRRTAYMFFLHSFLLLHFFFLSFVLFYFSNCRYQDEFPVRNSNKKATVQVIVVKIIRSARFSKWLFVFFLISKQLFDRILIEISRVISDGDRTSLNSRRCHLRHRRILCVT